MNTNTEDISIGVGARRVEVNEDHKIHSQSYVFFKAGTSPNSAQHRRTLSVGPGLFLDHDDSHSDESSERMVDASYEERRGREPTRGLRGGRGVRQLSADQTHYQPGYISHYNEQLPTPPYSPAYSPDATPLRRSPAPSILSPVGYDESPTYSTEEIRRALSDHASIGKSDFWPISPVLRLIVKRGRATGAFRFHFAPRPFKHLVTFALARLRSPVVVAPCQFRRPST